MKNTVYVVVERFTNSIEAIFSTESLAKGYIYLYNSKNKPKDFKVLPWLVHGSELEMSDRILLIAEICEKVKDRLCEGYRIKTEKHDLKLLIQSGQECCERWGYAVANEDASSFIGAEYLGYKTVYSDNILKAVDKDTADDIENGNLLFLNVETSRGTLDFTVYNAHNGYYGHDAFLIVDGNIVNYDCL